MSVVIALELISLAVTAPAASLTVVIAPAVIAFAVTAPAAIFPAVIAPAASFAVSIAPSLIFVAVIAPALITDSDTASNVAKVPASSTSDIEIDLVQAEPVYL